MAPAALGAGRDIDRTVFLHLTQGDSGIEHRGFFKPQTQRTAHFHRRRDPFVPAMAQVVGTLAHDPLIETRWRVGSYP